MATNKTRKFPGLSAGVAVLGMLLASCSKAPAPAEPAASPPASEAPASEAPAAAPAPSTETPPADAAEPAPSPGPTAPPPTEPSPAAKPTAAANSPALESMERATPSAKMSVPVDLRFHFEGDPVANRPVTLHLAAVPRVAGSHLRVSVKQASGIALKGNALEVQKASAAGIYRQQFAVTKSTNAADTLRVLVTMDMPEGKAFGYFSVPVGAVPVAGGSAPQKSESVKQR